MLLGLMGAVSEHFFEEAVFQLEAELQLLHDVSWNGVDLSQQGGAKTLKTGSLNETTL